MSSFSSSQPPTAFRKELSPEALARKNEKKRLNRLKLKEKKKLEKEGEVSPTSHVATPTARANNNPRAPPGMHHKLLDRCTWRSLKTVNTSTLPNKYKDTSNRSARSLRYISHLTCTTIKPCELIDSACASYFRCSWATGLEQYWPWLTKLHHKTRIWESSCQWQDEERHCYCDEVQVHLFPSVVTMP